MHLSSKVHHVFFFKGINQWVLIKSTLLFLPSSYPNVSHWVFLSTSRVLYFKPLTPTGAADRCMGTGLSTTGAWVTCSGLSSQRKQKLPLHQPSTANHSSARKIHWLGLLKVSCMWAQLLWIHMYIGSVMSGRSFSSLLLLLLTVFLLPLLDWSLSLDGAWVW